MNKTIKFLLLLLATASLSSCIRTDDLEILRHPIHVTGTVNPEYGVPVAYGEMNLNDILSRLSSEFQGILDTDNVVTVVYEASAADTIKALSSISTLPAPNYARLKPSGTKDGFTIYSKDTIIIDTIDIDFFNEINGLDSMNIEHIWLNIGVRAYGECWDSIRPYISATFDRLAISYEDHNGLLKQFHGLTVAPVQVDDIGDGFDRQFDSVDIASIVNDMPRRIFTTYRFRFNVSSAIISSDIAGMPYGQVLDSVRMTRLIYAADLKVSMPLSVEFNNMEFEFPNLDLGDGFSTVNLDSILQSISEGMMTIDVDSTLFRLALDNGIPLDMTLNAILKDANGNSLYELFDNQRIASAVVVPDPAVPTRYVASEARRTVIEKHLNVEDIEKITSAKSINLKFRIDSDDKHVVIRRNDFLKVKAYLQIRPTVKIDIGITDNGLIK